MKYIEELNSGDVFNLGNKLYILTSDFRKNGCKMAINLIDGFPSWFNPDTVIVPEPA